VKLILSIESSLLEAIRELVPGASNRTLRQFLQHGRVRLNGATSKIATQRVVPGDAVEIATQGGSHPKISGLEIVYDDQYLVLVEKPAGLLTVATLHEQDKTAYAHLRAYLKGRNPRQKLFIVHRLDKFASGVLVFAKSEPVQAKLQALFSRHNIRRKYWAIVEGKLEKDHGTIRSYLAENRVNRMHSIEDGSDGKLAVTHFRVLKRFPQLTALEVTLETGRKNQIRAHFAEMGHPIVGDRAYGSTMNPIGRLGLHAFLLAFKHPVLGSVVEHKTKVPAGFARYLPHKRMSGE
jgi:23S rRNA pseudouridine1911/1915/1917 synthase